MKRNALMFFALAVIAFALASTIPVGPQQATGFTSAEDTTLVVRRMYEGLRPDMSFVDASPDGRYVTQWDRWTGDLAVLDLLTGEKHHVTAKTNGWAEDSFAEQSQFSPDGKAIAYVWYLNGNYQIRVIGVDGSKERVVLPGDPSIDDWPHLHDWSPDGTQLLVTHYFEKDADLLLIDVENGTTRILLDFPKGYGPDAAGFSPDGRYVGFDINAEMVSEDQHAPEEHDLYTISIDGGREVRLLGGPTHDRFLGFSPSGDDILFQSDRNVTEGVWRLSIRDGQAAGKAELVKGDLWNIQRVGVSGGRLLYGIITERETLYTAGIDLARGRLTSQPAPVETPEPEAWLGEATWSQDGLMLAYPRLSLGEIKLIIRSVDGGQAQEIETAFRRGRRLWWTADQDRLLVLGRSKSDPDWRGLFQIDLRTGKATRYLNSDGVARWAALTADRKTAYYAQWDGTLGTPGDAHFLNRHDLETGAIDRIARLDTLLSGLMIMRTTELSPDEQSLAFQSYNRQTEEWTVGVISTVTGEARELATHPVQVSDHNDPNDPDVTCDLIKWTDDAQSIVYARAVTGQRDCTIYRIPAEGGEVEAIGKMPSHVDAVLTPDQSRVVFGHGELRGEIWMMDNIPWSSDR